jgi:hypothetical protein
MSDSDTSTSSADSDSSSESETSSSSGSSSEEDASVVANLKRTTKHHGSKKKGSKSSKKSSGSKVNAKIPPKQQQHPSPRQGTVPRTPMNNNYQYKELTTPVTLVQNTGGEKIFHAGIKYKDSDIHSTKLPIRFKGTPNKYNTTPPIYEVGGNNKEDYIKGLFRPDINSDLDSNVYNKSFRDVDFGHVYICKITLVEWSNTMKKDVAMRWEDAEYLNTVPCSDHNKDGFLFTMPANSSGKCNQELYNAVSVLKSETFGTFGHQTLNKMLETDVTEVTRIGGNMDATGVLETSSLVKVIETNDVMVGLTDEARAATRIHTIDNKRYIYYPGEIVATALASLQKRILSHIRTIDLKKISFSLSNADGTTFQDLSGTVAEGNQATYDRIMAESTTCSALLNIHYVFPSSKTGKKKVETKQNGKGFDLRKSIAMKLQTP